MRRRTLITGAAASGIGGIALIGTGAFDTASAERTATVNFADDEDAYLGLVSKSAYATTDGDGELALAFGDVSGDGDGIGRNSQFFFDEVFAIANQGTETVSITASSDTDAFDGEFRLYPTGDRDGTLDDEDNAIVLETGEEQSVGTHVETGDVDVTNELDIEITIEAAFEEGGDEPDEPEPEPPETIDETEFFSTSSLVDANGEVLDDDSVVAVWAEATADNENSEDDDGFVSYPDDTGIPLAAADGNVVGFGADLGPDASSEDDNRTLIANAWQTVLDGTGTVLYDETHGQELTLDAFSQLQSVAEGRGFDVESIDSDFVGSLDGADAVMIATSDGDVASVGGFSDTERSELADFVDDGGAVFLHGTASFDGTSNDALNAVLADLDAAFRFNFDQVVDNDNNGGDFYIPRTSNFNDDEFPDFFLAEGEL
ncbi:DUF1102 domain-containing protein [Halorubrum salipaludis]|uniref:DUF1102 domain-containing protein n=1 Tax=Halorubrum salipaludis TaxID=2032630 RepID=A0A2A2FEH3_9EURY|nr:DUF1102 domain-containing protein [Halorubrum salipaludis]PAU83230.1 DUF1102 domain-containing protein [Halorubrum salipaludis]